MGISFLCLFVLSQSSIREPRRPQDADEASIAKRRPIVAGRKVAARTNIKSPLVLSEYPFLVGIIIERALV